MPIQFQCPTCYVKLGIGSRKAGKVITCPKCNGLVKVPVDSRSAPLTQSAAVDTDRDDSDAVELVLDGPRAQSDLTHEDRREETSAVVSKCPMCQAQFLIGSQQVGTRIRCGKCNFDFISVGQPPKVVQGPGTIPPPVVRAIARTPTMTASVETPTPPPMTREDKPIPSNLRRAKASAHYDLPATLVFQAVVQAIRGFQTTILEMRQSDFHVRFAFIAQGVETVHSANVFDILNQQCDVELVSVDLKPENSFVRHYDAILAELAKYLKFATPPFDDRRQGGSQSIVFERREEIDNPPDYDERRDCDEYREPGYDNYREREGEYSRRQKSNAGGGLAIAGLVCGVASLLFFCYPYVSIPTGVLGIVFGACGFGSKHKGLAIGGFVCAIVGMALYLVLILAIGVVLWRH